MVSNMFKILTIKILSFCFNFHQSLIKMSNLAEPIEVESDADSKNNDSSDDSQDEIEFEIPVYLNQTLSDELHIVQYPLRDMNNPIGNQVQYTSLYHFFMNYPCTFRNGIQYYQK